ncbi:unnamed protein product [Arctogadus glacialis]
MNWPFDAVSRCLRVSGQVLPMVTSVGDQRDTDTGGLSSVQIASRGQGHSTLPWSTSPEKLQDRLKHYPFLRQFLPFLPHPSRECSAISCHRMALPIKALGDVRWARPHPSAEIGLKFKL